MGNEEITHFVMTAVLDTDVTDVQMSDDFVIDASLLLAEKVALGDGQRGTIQKPSKMRRWSAGCHTFKRDGRARV